MTSRYDGRINIPRNVQDPHYRYHMPTLQLKMEGKGNGKKTLVINLEKVAKSLERPPHYLAHFFSIELATKMAIDEKKGQCTLNGHCTSSSLDSAVDVFIEKFILCHNCRYPETIVENKGEVISLRCMACGGVSRVDQKHRFTSFVQKQLKKTTETSHNRYEEAERKVEERDNEKMDEDANVEDDFGDDWGDADFSSSAIEARRAQLLGLREGDIEEGDPIDLLADFISSSPSKKDIAERLKTMSLVQGWNEGNTLNALFGALCDTPLVEEIGKKIDILSHFVHTRSDQKRILYLTEKLASKDTLVSTKITTILNAYYENDLIDEELLLKWYKNPTKRIDPDLGRILRERSKKFIDWIQTADEE